MKRTQKRSIYFKKEGFGDFVTKNETIPVDNCKFVFVFNVNICTLWLSDRQSAKILKPLLNDWQ